MVFTIFGLGFDSLMGFILGSFGGFCLEEKALFLELGVPVG